MMNRFQDRIVLVTGGSSGIGLAAATAFAREGAHVIITGRDSDALARAEKEIGPSARAMRSDASSLAELGALAADIATTHSRIDTLFVNAGWTVPTPMDAISVGTFDAMIDVHVKGPFFLIQQLAPMMHHGATVVLNGSVSAILGMPGMSAYAAGKAGLVSLTRSLSAELLPKGIRVNAASAGPVATPASARADIPEHVKAAMLAQIPLGRPATPEEVAAAVLFLAAPESSFIIGHNLVVDGGMSIL